MNGPEPLICPGTYDLMSGGLCELQASCIVASSAPTQEKCLGWVPGAGDRVGDFGDAPRKGAVARRPTRAPFRVVQRR